MKFEEILTGAGLDENAVKQVLDQMKSNKIYTAGEENLDIRYGKLKEQSESEKSQLTEAQALIESLKAGNADNEGLQAKVQEYESTIEDLRKKMVQAQVDAEIKVAILEAGGEDVDYLSYKIQHSEDFAVDKDGKIKDLQNIVKDVKTAYPQMFKKSDPDGFKPLTPPEGKPAGEKITKEEFAKWGYAKKAALYQEDPETYKKLNGGK